MAKVGDRFPNVTLQGTMRGETKDYNLGQNPGVNRVFVFFPFAFTAN